jgi:hypothetical protein
MLLARPLAGLVPPSTHAPAVPHKVTAQELLARPSVPHPVGAHNHPHPHAPSPPPNVAHAHGHLNTHAKLPPVPDPKSIGLVGPGWGKARAANAGGRLVPGTSPIPAHGLVVLLDGVDAVGGGDDALRNPMLLLLREHLLALPPWVRFVVSSSPPRAAREVCLCLAIRCAPLVLAPADLQAAREVQVGHGAGGVRSPSCCVSSLDALTRVSTWPAPADGSCAAAVPHRA